MAYLLGTTILVSTVLAVGVLQARFIDAYSASIGSPSRAERQQLFFRRPAQYLRLLRSGKAFRWATLFQPSADAIVESRRRQLLIGIAALPPGMLFGMWLSVSGRPSTPGAIVALEGIIVAISWGVVLLRSRIRALEYCAIIGIVAGLTTAVVAVMR
jgi:hypothetical protein